MANSTKTTLRAAWAVPAAVALVIGTVAAAPAMSQAASPDLPEISASELLTKVAQAEPQAFSGSVSVTSDLGLPDLSSLSGALGAEASASPLALATGTHKVKVWFDPKVGKRANIEAPRSEYSVVATEKDVWTYSSSDNAAGHLAIPAGALDEARSKAQAKAAEMPTPEELSKKLLTEIDPSTALTIDRTATVAGRDAYQVVATPKDSGSLIASVRVAIDAKTWQPLRAEVYSTANSAKPALSSAFTAIAYAKPAASVFDFSAPKGADVTEIPFPTEHPDTDGAKPDVTVSGKGWASIVTVSGVGDMLSAEKDRTVYQEFGDGSDMPMSMPADDASALMDQLSKKVDGGTLYQTNLFSVLVTDDGRVLAGAVPGASLQAAAK